MKKTYVVVMFCLLGVISIVSCNKENFLDQTQTTTLNEQTVFADSAYTMNFLNGIYANVGFSTNPYRFSNYSGTMPGLDASCDEAEGYISGNSNTFIQFASGTVNADIVSKDAWQTSYANIRAVNMFLKNLPGARFANQLKIRVKAEARFLRAWYYFTLLEHYGGIPLVGDTLYTSSSSISESRNTFEDCVNYIVQECDTAASYLPWIETGNEYGRVNKGACLGLKARVLLYAASPLFNGGGIAVTEPLKSITGYPTYDKERWNKAQNAALDLISSGQYSLVVDNNTAPGYGFYSVFLKRKSSELIFASMKSPNRDLEDNWLPPSTMGSPVAFPYLELVNAFGMNNGLPITDPASNYDPNNPYLNRDPRFDYTFIHDQTPVMRRPEIQKFPVYIYIDATDPNRITSGVDAVRKGTLTGYYIYKMVDQTVAPQWFNTLSQRCMPLIRYAEILLDFAEARNEYLDAPDDQVYGAVEAIRQRAGLSPYQLPAGLSQSDMRKAIQEERQRELAFEGHRFWDVRRWKIATETQNRMMHGTEPTKTSLGITYKTFDVRVHNFVDKMYLWPIPQSEVSKSPLLLQNPGY